MEIMEKPLPDKRPRVVMTYMGYQKSKGTKMSKRLHEEDFKTGIRSGGLVDGIARFRRMQEAELESDGRAILGTGMPFVGGAAEPSEIESVERILRSLMTHPEYREKTPEGDRLRQGVVRGYEIAYPGLYRPGSFNKDSRAAVTADALRARLTRELGETYLSPMPSASNATTGMSNSDRQTDSGSVLESLGRKIPSISDAQTANIVPTIRVVDPIDQPISPLQTQSVHVAQATGAGATGRTNSNAVNAGSGSPAPSVAPPLPKSLADIDLAFIHGEEGFRTDGYVPADSKGNPIQQSGITIGYGVDLG